MNVGAMGATPQFNQGMASQAKEQEKSSKDEIGKDVIELAGEEMKGALKLDLVQSAVGSMGSIIDVKA